MHAGEAMGFAVHECLVQQHHRLGSNLAAIPREDQEQRHLNAVTQLYIIASLVQINQSLHLVCVRTRYVFHPHVRSAISVAASNLNTISVARTWQLYVGPCLMPWSVAVPCRGQPPVQAGT